jgi:hypothetical protein
VVRNYSGDSAEAAPCADHGDFSELHDDLLTNPKNLGWTGISGSGTSCGLDIPKFPACLEGNKHAEGVWKDEAATTKSGVKDTPTFFLGGSDVANPSKIRRVIVLSGSPRLLAFQETLERSPAK